MGAGSAISSAVSSGLDYAALILADLTGIFGVLVGIGIAAAAFSIVASFVKR